jgi:hypothetical protein
MRRFIANVEPDCDGIFTSVYRVDIPAGLEDADAMRKAVELGQVEPVRDPSEWFTVPSHLEERAAEVVGRYPSKYGTCKGNLFR